MEREKYKLLEKAIMIASTAHFGQKDKSGMPYIFHPIRVMERCTTLDEKIVAILHDVIEDTEVTASDLTNEEFPAHIVEAIEALTRLESESYEGFIKRLSNNQLAKNVKIADLQDNLDLSRLSQISDKDITRAKKYIKALNYLLGKDIR